MRMEAGRTYTFGKSVDDWTYAKIDGRVYLDNGSHNTFLTCAYTAAATGWIPVEFRFGNGGGGAGVSEGARWGFAYNTANETGWDSFKAGRSPWAPVLDPGDGSLLRVSAERSLAVTRAETTAASVGVAATLSAGHPAVGSIVAVWGSSDLGTEAAPTAWTGWTTVRAVNSGDEIPVSGTLSFNTVAYPVLRLAFVPADAGMDTVWSDPVLLDADDPTIGPVRGVADGDVLSVSGTMAGRGSGAGLALELLWGYREDLSDARSTNLVVDAQGAFAGTVGLVPDTNGWWRLVARTQDGGVDATIPAAFDTHGASILRSYATASVVHHTISASGSLDVLGAGVTTATVWAGSSEDDLAPVAGSSATLGHEGAFVLEAVIPGDPHTVYWKIVSENVAPGGTAWTNETPVYSIATVDQATYTWRAECADGCWTNRACWTVTGIADENDCIGYPNHAKCTVLFTDGTAAAIDVPAGEFKFEHMDLNVNSLDLAFVGEGANASTLYGNVWGANDNSVWNGWRVVFDNLTLREENNIQLGGPRTQNATLRFQNGAFYSISGYQESKGTNVWLEAVGGSTLHWRNGDGDGAGLTLWVADGGFLLEDSTANPPDFNYERGKACGNQQVILKGGSVFRIRRYGRPYSESEDPGGLGTLTISFSVPVDGWNVGVDAPVYANYVFGGADNKMLAWRSEGKEIPVVLEVDKDSPLLQSGRHRTSDDGTTAVQLLEWNAGIDTKNVTLSDRKGVKMYWTYGFPQARRTPTSPDEAPTGVAADIVGLGYTFLIFR